MMAKTKYIFITGGVVSSLGKGIAAAIPLPREETTPPVIKIYLVFAIIKDTHDGTTE